jgi:hypothetical protein
LIPIEEHRVLNSTQKIEWIRPYWVELMTEFRAHAVHNTLGRMANGTAGVEPAPKPETVVAITSLGAVTINEDAPRPQRKRSTSALKVVSVEARHPQAIKPVFNPEVEKAAAPVPKLSEFPLADLWAELGRRIEEATSADRLQSLIRQEVNAVLDRRLPGILAPDVEPVEEAVVTAEVFKLKICVIGLLNGQKDLITQEYKDRVDFLFMEQTPGLHKIQQTANHYHFVVQMIKYSNHVKGTNKIDNFVTLGGLLTQLRAFIERKLTKE